MRASKDAGWSLGKAMVETARTGRAAARTAVFFLKLFPMWSSTVVDWVTPTPVHERVRYPTRSGEVEADLYRPPGSGPHPCVVVCLGVVPFGVDHPQVPRLGAALARSGFATLLYWSSNMRELSLNPEDIDGIARAYRWLVDQPHIDPARSGLLGTCVGGSFALMAAADPRIREEVAFVCAFAPYSSIWTLARDIASSTRSRRGGRVPWKVDPLTRQVAERTFTSYLDAHEAQRIRAALAEAVPPRDVHGLSRAGELVQELLSAPSADDAQAALERLPLPFKAWLSRLSPMRYLDGIQAPLLVLGHDRNDLVIPVEESRRLYAALSGRVGAHYTEFAMFEHADPTKHHLPRHRLAQELGKFYAFAYPMFRQAVST